MKQIKSEDAVGKVLGADITEVIPGVKKEPLFKRGHIIKQDDIERLYSIGKKHVWIQDENDNSHVVHEDDAAKYIMDAIGGEFLEISVPSESKVKLISKTKGVVLLNEEGLLAINNFDNVRVAAKKNFSFIEEKNPVAIGKIMPVQISADELEEILSIADKYRPIIDLLPIKKFKVAIFPVGNEFLEGRRQETMSLEVKKYLEYLGQSVHIQEILPDDEFVIAEKGQKMLDIGYDIVIYMGGLSVDPDDKTTMGILNICDNLVTIGVPLWPGTTFVISYKDDKTILGVPSSAGLVKNGTSFHILMPIILSGYKLKKIDILKMANGGFIDAANL